MGGASVLVERRRIAEGPSWMLALVVGGVLSGLSIAVGIVTGVDAGIAAPLQRVLVLDRRSGEVLVEFDPPVFEAGRVLALMRTQAERLDREDFLRRWSFVDARRQELLEARIQYC